MPFSLQALSEATWEPYAALIERHNGIFGGCWCMGFHGGENPWALTGSERREAKRARVADGSAFAGLVFDGDLCIGWCQFGPTADLTRIKNRKAYDAGLLALPDWRITCFFVDKRHRRQGVAALALESALTQIASRGGGVVEAYPEDVGDKRVPTMALHAGTLGQFEAAGFERGLLIGKNKWAVRRTMGAGENDGHADVVE